MIDQRGHCGNRHDQRIAPQLIFGLIVIVVGVLFTLDNLGIVQAERYVRYWPVALIAIGVVKIWQSRDGLGGTLAGFVFFTAGVWLLLEELALLRVSFFDLWPLLLVFLGAYLVWQGMTGRQREAAAPVDEDVPAGNTPGEETMNVVAVLGGVSRGSNSRAFRGANLTAIMGGCEIDLRHAAIHGEAVIDVFAMWGGIEIRVPEEWTVESRVTPVLGGVDDKTRPPQNATAHRLILRGMAIMGGVEVKN